MKLYLTTVWPVDAHQTQVSSRQQADDIAQLAELGYKAFKIRIWRPDPMEDVAAVRNIRLCLGGAKKVEIMLDRTGDASGEDWDDATGAEVAAALYEAGAQWLEEPFVRGDIARHARLRAASRLPITGGEHQPLEVYNDYFQGQSFDIIQPHCANILLHLKKIASAAELFGVDCIFHGSHGMDLIGSLQVGATIPSCRMQEIVFTTPAHAADPGLGATRRAGQDGNPVEGRGRLRRDSQRTRAGYRCRRRSRRPISRILMPAKGLKCQDNAL